MPPPIDTLLSDNGGDVTGPGSFAYFVDALPLGAGMYRIDNNFSDAAAGPGGTWDYSWTLTVSSVPEPTTFLLLGLGLAGLVVRRKHRY